MLLEICRRYFSSKYEYMRTNFTHIRRRRRVFRLFRLQKLAWKIHFFNGLAEYLTITDCTTVDYVKETVFRKYDTNPRDGKLSYDELYNAFLTHDVDSSYMTKELTEDGYTG